MHINLPVNIAAYTGVMTYEQIRQQYRPKHIKVLLIAESPPPAADVQSSRHFYRSEAIRRDDRLFTNTIRALYPTTERLTEKELEIQKVNWLKQLQADGWYMVEALDHSQPHEITKQQRQKLIHDTLPHLLDKVRILAESNTKIILIKSNVFDVAAEPLRRVGFDVLNTRLLDYPGHFNQQAYRDKLRELASQA